MDGFSNGDGQRLESGLASILTAARGLETTMDQDLALREDRDAS